MADGCRFETFEQNIMESVLILRYPFGYVRVEKMNKGALMVIGKVHGVFHDVKAMIGGAAARGFREGAKFLFRIYPELQRLECTIPEQSRSLRRLLTEAGLVYEGTMRQWYRFADGSIINAVMFSVVREGSDG